MTVSAEELSERKAIEYEFAVENLRHELRRCYPVIGRSGIVAYTNRFFSDVNARPNMCEHGGSI